MSKYIVIVVINREINTFITTTLGKAQEKMKKVFQDYLEEEDLENGTAEYGESSHECWITGDYNNVDILIDEV